MPEQELTASAADSKEVHTDIQQAPNVSHTDEVATTDDSSAVQCGEGTCDAGGDAAPARFDAGEATQYTAADFHPCKSDIVMMPDNLRLYPVERSSRGKSLNDPGVSLEGSTADEWPRWYGTEMADRSMGRMTQPLGRTSLSSCGIRHRWCASTKARSEV